MVRKFSGGAIHDRTHDNQKSHRKRTRARNRGGSNPTEGQTEKTSQKTETTKTSTENHFHLRLTTFHHLLFLFWINARKLRRKNTCSTHEICIHTSTSLNDFSLCTILFIVICFYVMYLLIIYTNNTCTYTFLGFAKRWKIIDV